jgi:hypothetical protein
MFCSVGRSKRTRSMGVFPRCTVVLTPDRPRLAVPRQVRSRSHVPGGHTLQSSACQSCELVRVPTEREVDENPAPEGDRSLFKSCRGAVRQHRPTNAFCLELASGGDFKPQRIAAGHNSDHRSRA